jgi:hypothetical protein
MAQTEPATKPNRAASTPPAHHASDEAPLLVVLLAKARHIRLNYMKQLGHDLQQQQHVQCSAHTLAACVDGCPKAVLSQQRCTAAGACLQQTEAHSQWRRRGRSVGGSRHTCPAAAAAQSPMSRARLGVPPLAPPRCQRHLQHQPLQRPGSNSTHSASTAERHIAHPECL